MASAREVVAVAALLALSGCAARSVDWCSQRGQREWNRRVFADWMLLSHPNPCDSLAQRAKR